MKVCILSDSHDHIPLLREAVAHATTLGAEAILHCGDLVAPSTLNCLKAQTLPIYVIHGNNTGDLVNLTRMAHHTENPVDYRGMDAKLELAGKRIFLVHYPHYARAMAATGDYDLVCAGHTHKVNFEQIKNLKGTITHYVNPGTVGGVGSSASTWVLADLTNMTFETYEVDKSIEFKLA